MDTDQGLAIGAIATMVLFGLCGCAVCFYKDCYRKHTALKQSRSDPDLENMVTREPSEERYASPQVPVSITS
jgi:hypothetical protein